MVATNFREEGVDRETHCRYAETNRNYWANLLQRDVLQRASAAAPEDCAVASQIEIVESTVILATAS